MKKNLTFIIFTVLIITSCSQNVDEGVENGKENVSQEQLGDTYGKLKAVGGNATDEVQGSESAGENDFNNNQ